MEQIGVVMRELNEGTAEVMVTREGACGGKCVSCVGSCRGGVQRLSVIARNDVEAKVGDRVVIYSSSKEILAAAAMVYLLPIVGFIAGYVAAAMSGAGTLIRALGGIGALIAGIAAVVVVNRSRTRRGKGGAEVVVVGMLAGR